jgi:cytidyltransferase-like protein
MRRVFVSGGFDDLHSRQVRFLQEAGRLGEVNVLLWSDSLLEERTGKHPRFPQEERQYFVDSLRYVEKASIVDDLQAAYSLMDSEETDLWVAAEGSPDGVENETGMLPAVKWHILKNEDLVGFPKFAPLPSGKPRGTARKVMVTGTFDWLHSGHVRFFEEAAGFGDLYVVVGHDANIELLKGKGHPMFPQDERRYMVEAVRFVRQAIISSGDGWMDAAPEVEIIHPDLYVVNEDGDRPEKREFCRTHSLEYLVLQRLPREGLPRRESRRLRGF